MKTTITSKPCREVDHPADMPRVLELELTDEQLEVYNREHLIQRQLPDQPAGVRERFISGMCPHCWNTLFAVDEDEDDS